MQDNLTESLYHIALENIIYNGKWIINRHNELLKKYGLALSQHDILTILRKDYPKALSVKLIQDRMYDKMSDDSRSIELMRRKGLVARELCPEDRRRVDVTITKKGLDLLAAIDKNESVPMDNFLSDLNMEEVEQLNTLLDKLTPSES